MKEIVNLRHLGMKALVGVCWLITILVLIGSMIAGSGFAPVLLALALVAVPTLLMMSGKDDCVARIAIGATLPLFSAVLLYQWSGATWQVDLHMTFFALIAMLPMLVDWRPIVAATVVTALHHLLLSYIAPSLVFGATGDLFRVVLHAVILLVETGVLIALVHKLSQVMIQQEAAQEEKERVTLAAERERESAEAERREVVEEIGTAMQALARGDLGHRLNRRFPPQFEELREDFNRSVGDLAALVSQVSRASSVIQAGSAEMRTEQLVLPGDHGHAARHGDVGTANLAERQTFGAFAFAPADLGRRRRIAHHGRSRRAWLGRGDADDHALLDRELRPLRAGSRVCGQGAVRALARRIRRGGQQQRQQETQL